MRLYLVTGEPSGDLHAANLVRELKNLNNNIKIRGWGGERLIAEGIDLVQHIKDTSFMGFWNVLSNLQLIRKNLNFCKQDIIDFKPDAILLVDYPGFNLRIAKFAKNKGIKVFYYIAPKLWAWNKYRIYKIKKYVDELLVIFPFEVDFYKNYNINAIYVGNPLIDEHQKTNHISTYKTDKSIIALLPGSRKQEIERILPQMLTIVDDFPDYQFVVAGVNLFSEKYYKSFIGYKNVDLVIDETYSLLSNSVLAVVASGTATLEAALLNVPQVVCYKTHWVTYIIAKFFVRIRYISLVNIILNKLVVKELIQSEFNKNNLERELRCIINDRQNILLNYQNIRHLLDKKGASYNASNYIIDCMRSV